jgi:hypothetical protein
MDRTDSFRRFLLLPCLCALIPFLAGCAAGRKAEIAGLLLQFKHDEQNKGIEMDQETRDFWRAKKAVLENQGVAPVNESAAREIFGQPASVFKRGTSTVWGYKPGFTDWFHGEKVFVTFDEKHMLSSVEYQPSS